MNRSYDGKKQAELEDLLLEMFGVDELRRFLRGLPQGRSILNALPGRGEPVDRQAEAAVSRLDDRGLIDGAFFDQLAGERPRRAASIRRVQRLWGIAPVVSRAARHNLPFTRNPHFVGREEDLARLERLLSPRATVAVATPRCLAGLGGMGKTQLALEFAYRHLNRYERVLWVAAQGEEIGAQVADLAPVLDLDLPPDTGGPLRAERVRCALESGARYLLIFDNVDRRGVVEPHLPRGGRTDVLITTRRLDLDLPRLDIDALSSAEALRLLFGGLHEDEGDEGAGLALCRELGFLTIAIDVARGILSLGLRTASDLLSDIREAGPSSFDPDNEDGIYSRGRTEIGRLFDTSLSLLSDRNPRDLLARHLFFAGGWFAPSGVPPDLLVSASCRVTGDPAPPEKRLVRACERLIGLGLASTDEERNIVFHRALMDYARRRGGERYREAVEEVLYDRSWSKVGDTLELMRLSSLRPHLEAVAERLTARTPEDRLGIFYCLAEHLRHNDFAHAAIAQAERGLEIATGDVWRGNLLDAMGKALWTAGRREEALDRYHEALECRNRQNPQGTEEPTILTNIGAALLRMDRKQEALERFRKAFEHLEQSRGREDRETATALMWVGTALSNLGRVGESLDHHWMAIEAMEAARGREHVDTAYSYQHLADTLGRSGRYDEAIRHYQRALDIWEATVGAEHQGASSIFHQMGSASDRAGRYPEAIEYYRRALAIELKTLGEEHRETANTLHSMGSAFSNAGRYDEALEHYRRALAIRTSVLGAEHEDTGP